jgi:bacteriocin-like protein
MNKPHKLSDFTDMSKEEFTSCLAKMNRDEFIKDPTKALIEAGVSIKQGITFKFVETETEKNKLPANIIPLPMHMKHSDQLSEKELDSITGGAGTFSEQWWKDEFPDPFS